MKSNEVFSKISILKILLITISFLVWIYFYISSKINLDILIIFDLSSIINIASSINFILFLFFFPITTCLIIGLSAKQDKLLSIIQITIALVIACIFAIIIFGLGGKFILFTLFYLITHLIIALITNFNFSLKDNKVIKAIYDCCSKAGIAITILIFIVVLIIIAPKQKEHALNMEAGIVNLFVGDDISKWIGTSYEISRSCTKQNIDFLMDRSEFKNLSNNSDNNSKEFIRFMNNVKNEVSSSKTTEELSSLYPSLDSENLKTKVLDTIRQIPLLIIIENYFAVFFAIMIASLVYIYFAIVFLSLGLLYTYIFYKIFENNFNTEQ
ncbi:MAG: hypothetical protein V1824_01040 [archaeon]